MPYISFLLRRFSAPIKIKYLAAIFKLENCFKTADYISKPIPYRIVLLPK